MNRRATIGWMFLFVACVAGAASPTTPPAAKADEPVRCESDADCPHLACGPCDAGAPITQAMLGGPACAVNPCLDASAVCNAQHTCEIGPRTRKNPALWRKP
jgi:hypothetical protein